MINDDCFPKVEQLAMELHLPPIHQQNRHSPRIVHPKLHFPFFSNRRTWSFIGNTGFNGCWKFCKNCTDWASEWSAMKWTQRWAKASPNAIVIQIFGCSFINQLNFQVKNQSGTGGYHAFLEVVLMKDSVWNLLNHDSQNWLKRSYFSLDVMM